MIKQGMLNVVKLRPRECLEPLFVEWICFKMKGVEADIKELERIHALTGPVVLPEPK